MSSIKSATNKSRAMRDLLTPAKAVQSKTAKKPVAKKPAAKRVSSRPSDGHEIPNGALVAIPTNLVKPVPPGKIQANLEKASQPILRMAKEFASRMEGEAFAIKEIEFSVSFDADGKFLGVGVGGAASIKIVIAPSAT